MTGNPTACVLIIGNEILSGRPNNAEVLMLVDGATTDKADEYELICTIFDGSDEEALALARTQWKSWQGKVPKQTYWQQNGTSWEQKA